MESYSIPTTADAAGYINTVPSAFYPLVNYDKIRAIELAIGALPFADENLIELSTKIYEFIKN